MRYFDDIRNADKWNTDLNRQPNDGASRETAEAAVHDPVMPPTARTEGKSPVSDTQASVIKPKEVKKEPSSTVRRPGFSPEMTVMNKRRSRKGKSMPFIAAGLLISTISGVITFIWLASSGTNEISAAQDSVYAEESVMPESVNFLDDDTKHAGGSDFADADEDSVFYGRDKEYDSADAIEDAYRGSRDEAEYLAGGHDDDISFTDDYPDGPAADEAEIMLPDVAEHEAESNPGDSEEFHASFREEAYLLSDDKVRDFRPARDAGKEAVQEKSDDKTAPYAPSSPSDGEHKEITDNGQQRGVLSSKSAQKGILVIPVLPRDNKPALTTGPEDKKTGGTVSASQKKLVREPSGSVNADSGNRAETSRFRTARKEAAAPDPVVDSPDNAVPVEKEEKTAAASPSVILSKTGTDTAPSVPAVTAKPAIPMSPPLSAAGSAAVHDAAMIPSKEKAEVHTPPAGKKEQAIQMATAVTQMKENEARVRTIQAGLSSALKEMSVNYEDQFNTHTNNWPEYNDSTASALIEDGEYHVQHKAKAGSHTVLHPYGVPAGMDFMLNVGISSVLGMGENSYGFVFGAANRDNNYSFQIHNGNSYTIERTRNGTATRLVSGSIDNIFIGEDSFQTLKIVKQGDRLRFYINDFYIAEIDEAAFSGDKVGFIVKGEVKISVDWTKTQIRFRNS